jgi:signal transduction histidine kinase/ActR/RegA family two-component response regulator
MAAPRRHDGADKHLDALQAAEGRFRNLIEKNADGIIVLRQDGAICYANPAAEALLGRDAAGLVGKPFGMPVMPGGAAEIDVLGGPAPCVAALRMVETEWQGDPAYLVSLRDVTERRRAEQALRFLAEASVVLAGSLDYGATLASVTRLAVAHLADWCFLDILEEDRLLRRVSGAHADPARNAVVRQLCELQTAPAACKEVAAQVLATGRSLVLSDFEQVHKLAPELGCRSALLVPLVSREQPIGVLTLGSLDPGRYSCSEQTLAEDLGRRAALALDRARLYQESQEAVRSRDEFLAMLAHELRNPLAPILNAAQILHLYKLSEPTLERAREVIDRQAHHLGRLLDDLLDIARVTCGKIHLRMEAVDLRNALRDALEVSRPLLEQQRHEVVASLPGESLPVEGDLTRLEQVFANLLNNAAKYTEPGGRIEVKALCDEGEAVVRVCDTGIGISREMLSHVFDLFTQAHPSLDRAGGGLGVGLNLVRTLVELHGGRVSAHSAGLGQGSEFVVRLPLQCASPGVTSDFNAPGVPKMRILLIEDNEDAREMLRDLLQLWGYHVDVAGDGAVGIKRALAERPDLALIDIGLPGIDGYEIARRLRTAPGGDALVLVALTGYGQPNDRAHATAAGFDAHLVKPAKAKELTRLLAMAGEGRDAVRAALGG